MNKSGPIFSSGLFGISDNLNSVIFARARNRPQNIGWTVLDNSIFGITYYLCTEWEFRNLENNCLDNTNEGSLATFTGLEEKWIFAHWAFGEERNAQPYKPSHSQSS